VVWAGDKGREEMRIEPGHPQYEWFLRKYQAGEITIVWNSRVWRAITDGQGGVFFVEIAPHSFGESYDGSSVPVQERNVFR